MRSDASVPSFRFGRVLKLGSFHLGSALADILVTGVWNRVLITDLGVAATPVAFLAAMRYFLAPLTIWIGHRSDTQSLFGYRRLSYIYLGRLLTWCSLPLLALVIYELAENKWSMVGWGLAFLIFLLYGLGTLVSGAPFLALVRESVPPAKQGLAVVMVQTVLLFGFAVVPISYAILMPDYSPGAFWRLVGVAMVGAFFAWTWSVWGEEREIAAISSKDDAQTGPDFGDTVRQLLSQPNTRTFFGLLSAGAIALFAQDAILEPFGGDIFALDVGATTRFNAYYGTGVLLAMMLGSYFTRRWLPQEYTTFTATGLVGMALSLGLLVMAALGRIEALLVPALFAFGVASGVYTVGGLSLMMAMTDDQHSGVYLGLWSMAQLVFRGVGIFLGGAVRDIGAWLTASAEIGYALVFGMEIMAALVALVLLYRVRRLGYLFTPQARGAQTVMIAD